MPYIEPVNGVPIGPLPDALDVGRPSAEIQWVTAPNGNGLWLVSGYKLARKILSDQRFTRSDAIRRKDHDLVSYSSAPEAIINLEGADHTRLRRLINPAFTEHRTAELVPFVAGSVTDLLDRLEARGAPADFVASVSSPLPVGVICRLLGLPTQDREIFDSWVNVLFRLDDDGTESRQHSLALMRYMVRVVAQKRRAPSDDLISQLIRSAEQEDRITNRELVTLCLSLLMAGFDTTVDQITLCVLTMILDRPLMKTLTHSPELIPRVTDEFVRLNPAAFVTFSRMVSEPVSIGGAIIHPGQPVVVYIMGSNRDPAIFDPANEITLGERVPPHLSFGYGVHRCLGAPLARLQLTTLLTELVKRFPDLKLADDLSSLTWKEGMGTRAPRQLPVSW
jgi:cytochrome P450